MDQRKRKRIALAAGLFFLAFLAGIVLTVKAARQNYESTARQMAALAEEIPESEAVFAGILGGKDTTGKSDQTKKGKELLAKYGYHFADSLRLGALPGYAGGMTLILAAGLLGCAAFSWYGWKKQKSARAQAEYLEEKLKEEKIRNQQMENALRREEQETKALITDISHQLKTPVAALNSCFEVLKNEDLTKDERREFEGRLEEQMQSLGQLVEALVNISRMETGMIELKLTEGRIFDVILEAVNRVWVKAQKKEIEIEMEAEDKLEDLILPLDSKWLCEALINLLDNAVKYSPPGTTVTIRAARMASFLRIEIQDQGIGIARENYHKVFQRFYRGDEKEVQKEEGSGVGLYLARKIIEGHHGTISLDGKKMKKEKGSVFVVQIPYR